LSVYKRFLRSSLVWRLSGLTYATAVNATSGKYRTLPEYLGFCDGQMRILAGSTPSFSTALEFGSGLGGNLFALRSVVTSGVGVDVNSLYVRQARRIATRIDCENVRFTTYNGITLPTFPQPFDLVFSVGVFERLAKNRVVSYVHQLVRLVSREGSVVLYFLTERARSTTFVERLGEEAYQYWSREEVSRLLADCRLNVLSILPWGPRQLTQGDGSVPVADLYVCEVGPARGESTGSASLSTRASVNTSVGHTSLGKA